MKIRTSPFSVVAFLLAACGAPATEGASGVAPASPTTIASFDAAAGELPEGFALKNGYAYVGFAPQGKIARVDLRTGEVARGFVSLPTPVPGKGFMTGIAFGPDGALYASLVSFDPSVQPGIYRAPASGGTATLFAKHEQMVFPNGLLFGSRGELFVTDSAAGAVFAIGADGAAKPWATSPLLAGDTSACGGSGNPFPIGANGLVAHGDAMFVTNTDKGSIVRIPIEADGAAGPTSLAVGPDCAALAGADGLVTDRAGGFVVAVNRQNKLVRVPASGGSITSVVGAPAEYPSTIAWNGTTAVWSNFAFANASSGKPAKPALLGLAE